MSSLSLTPPVVLERFPTIPGGAATTYALVATPMMVEETTERSFAARSVLPVWFACGMVRVNAVLKPA